MLLSVADADKTWELWLLLNVTSAGVNDAFDGDRSVLLQPNMKHECD